MSLRTYIPMPNPFIEAIETDDPDAAQLAVDWGLVPNKSAYLDLQPQGYLVRVHADGEVNAYVWPTLDGWIEHSEEPR